MLKKLLLSAALLMLVVGCSSVEKSKEFMSENNPLKEASRKESLSQAREDVKRSKKVYFKCMDEKDQDVYNCIPEREQYDKATDRYIELQQEDN